MTVPAQQWLDEIASHVQQLHYEKGELEKALFAIAAKIMAEHPEEIQNDIGISETARNILDNYSTMKRRIRRLTSDPDGARMWAIIEEEDKDERDRDAGGDSTPPATDREESGVGRGGEEGPGGGGEGDPGDGQPIPS